MAGMLDKWAAERTPSGYSVNAVRARLEALTAEWGRLMGRRDELLAALLRLEAALNANRDETRALLREVGESSGEQPTSGKPCGPWPTLPEGGAA
jgi:hypothetical protein